MAGLRRRVHHYVRPYGLHECQDASAVADVQFVVLEILVARFEAPLIPACVTLGTEEVGPHVVVNTVDRATLLPEIGDDLAPDQTARAGDE